MIIVLNPRLPITLYHGTVMVELLFGIKSLGLLVRIEKKMNHRDYINIMENNLLLFIQEIILQIITSFRMIMLPSILQRM